MFVSQGAVYSIQACDDGYVTGGKDGAVSLWDSDFKPITKIDLTQAEEGYQGTLHDCTIKPAVKTTCL